MQTVSALKKNKSQCFLLESIHECLWKSIFPHNLVSFFRFSLKCSNSRLAYEKRMKERFQSEWTLRFSYLFIALSSNPI